MIPEVKLYLGDCLDVLPTLEGESADAIIADLPYGVTACEWDEPIPLEPLWEQYKRIIKPRGAIVLFGSQPFTSRLVMSNLEWFKYEWVWEKNRGSNFATTKYMPMTEHENVLVFCGGHTTYNAQKIPRSPNGRARAAYAINPSNTGKRQIYSGIEAQEVQWIDPNWRCPRSILKFKTAVGLHPTQKPVALLAYLVRTYTNEGETVLDNTMGSGTTGVACIQTGRNFIGIEIVPEYFAIAQERIDKALREAKQPQQAAMSLPDG